MGELVTFMPAGGLGSRLRPHTLETPKPLLLMGSPDTTTIDHPLAVCRDISEHVWVSTDYLGDQIEEYLRGDSLVSTLRDRGTVGSGGSLAQHYDVLSELSSDGDLLILPSDHIYKNIDFSRYVDHHREYGADITLLTVPAKSYGEYAKVDNGKVISIERQSGIATPSTTGTYIFRNKFIMDLLKKFIADGDYEALNIYKDIVCPAIGKSAVTHYFVNFPDSHWEDTGTPDRFLSSNLLLSNGENVIDAGAIVDDEARLSRCIVLGNAVLDKHVNINDAIITGVADGSLHVTKLST